MDHLLRLVAHVAPKGRNKGSQQHQLLVPYRNGLSRGSGQRSMRSRVTCRGSSRGASKPRGKQRGKQRASLSPFRVSQVWSNPTHLCLSEHGLLSCCHHGQRSLCNLIVPKVVQWHGEVRELARSLQASTNQSASLKYTSICEHAVAKEHGQGRGGGGGVPHGPSVSSL